MDWLVDLLQYATSNGVWVWLGCVVLWAQACSLRLFTVNISREKPAKPPKTGSEDE